MKVSRSPIIWFILLFPIGIQLLFAQVPSGIFSYTEQIKGKSTIHELRLKDGYLIYTAYESDPSKFIKSLGGFYTAQNDTLNLRLEFHSDYDTDPVTYKHYAYRMEGKDLVLDHKTFKAHPALAQPLDGIWLFATRGPDTGQERRGDSNPRKTLKFLLDGNFQWIAYNTETLEFFGTGGGLFTAENGTYTENIAFFSRDNTRVGSRLQFTYKLQYTDWHHNGENSKGEPMYEIWTRRNQSAGSE